MKFLSNRSGHYEACTFKKNRYGKGEYSTDDKKTIKKLLSSEFLKNGEIMITDPSVDLNIYGSNDANAIIKPKDMTDEQLLEYAKELAARNSTDKAKPVSAVPKTYPVPPVTIKEEMSVTKLRKSIKTVMPDISWSKLNKMSREELEGLYHGNRC